MKFQRLMYGLLLLSGFSQAQLDAPEWEIWVPESAVMIDGVYADSNQPLLVDRAGGVAALPLQNYLDFELPDQASITAISFKETDDLDPTLLLTLDVNVSGYLAGTILSCQAGSCDSVYHPQTALGIKDGIHVDALTSVNSASIHVSFSQGFDFDGVFIDHRNVYALAVNNGLAALTLQSSGTGLGLGDQNNLMALDRNRDDLGISRYFGSDSAFTDPGGTVILATDLLGVINGASVTRFRYQLPAEIPPLSAYSGLNSGLIDFATNAIQVSESVGTLNLDLERFQGSESAVMVVVETIDGSAVNGVDYVFSTDVLTWLDDEGGGKSLPLQIIDNQMTDGNRVFEVRVLAASTFAVLNEPTPILTITITDDEANDLIFKDGFQ